jgi:hypothetical protein
MGSRKNKTLKNIKKRKGGNNSPDFFGKKTFLNMFQKTYDHEKQLEEKLKKADPNISIVPGKDLKPGCTYRFMDSSVYGKEFTVKAIKKDAEQGPKTAAGEQYILTNEDWLITSYPIGGNDKFIVQKCGMPSVKSTTNTPLSTMNNTSRKIKTNKK